MSNSAEVTGIRRVSVPAVDDEVKSKPTRKKSSLLGWTKNNKEIELCVIDMDDRKMEDDKGNDIKSDESSPLFSPVSAYRMDTQKKYGDI